MKSRHAVATLAIAAGLTTAFAPVAAAETIASLDYTAEQGAHPVIGKSGHWAASPENDVRAYELGDTLRVDAETDHGFDYIRLDFSAPSGAVQEGTYDHGGEHISSRFPTVAAEGLLALDVTFEQRCGSPTAPALRGEVHYRR